MTSKRGKSRNNKKVGGDISVTFRDEKLLMEEDSKSDEDKGEGSQDRESK